MSEAERIKEIIDGLEHALKSERHRYEYGKEPMLQTDTIIPIINARNYLSELQTTALRAQEQNEPLTWNKRINQMTAEEKAELIEKITTECPFAFGYTRKQSCDRYEDCCLCWTEWLKSPYEPTHAPEKGEDA